MSVSPMRIPLVERLQQRVTTLEREAAFLRQVDETMRGRLQLAVEETERLTKAYASQAATIVDLRRQLDARTGEAKKLRADLDAERLARVLGTSLATEPAKAEEQLAPPTRFNLLEVD